MIQKGLGIGLGALLGEAALEDDAPKAASSDFEYIPIQRIEPRQDQPRSFFEQEKLDDLTDSIREHGVLSPILVRSLDSGYYQIVAGERRWRAARAAGLTDLPARIVDADEKNAMEIALVENLQREDLSPIEEARGYKSLMEEFAMTQEEVSQRVGKSRPAIANSLRLLSLPDQLLELISQGSLSAGSARAILVLKSQDSMIEAAETIIANDLSVREVEKLVKKLERDRLKSNEENIPDENGVQVDYWLEAQDRLSSALGRRILIKRSRNKGSIEIDYYDQEDFDELFDALIKIGSRDNKKGMVIDD